MSENNESSQEKTEETKSQEAPKNEEQNTSESQEETSSTNDQNQDSENSSEGFLGEATKEEESPKQEEQEPFEIEFSEESPFEKEKQEALAEKIKGLGISKEKAAELVKELEATHSSASNSVVEQIQAKIKADREAMMKSDLFSTDSAKIENFKKINEVAKKFGDDEFAAFLNSSAGNSLALAKFLIRIADAGASDNPTDGKGAPQDGGGEKTLAQKWYPQFFEQNNS